MEKPTIEDVNDFCELMDLPKYKGISPETLRSRSWICNCSDSDNRSLCVFFYNDEDLGTLAEKIRDFQLKYREQWKTYLKLINKDFL